MAYGTYILIEFKSEDNDLYSIAVQRDGYSLAPIERYADADALTIEYGDGAATDYPGVMGSRAIFRFHQENDNNEFPSLYSTDKRKYKVVITKNAATFWVGWLKTENYSTSMKYRPVIELTATDGLADLKTMDFADYTSYAGAPSNPSNRQTRHTVIKDMLALTDLGLNYTVGTTMTEAKVNSNYYTGVYEKKNPFTGLYVNVAVYAESTCREALEDCLKTHTLFQRDGVWTIRNWHSHTLSSIYVYTYNSSGTQLSKGTVGNAAKQVDNDSIYFTGNPSCDFIAAIRKMLVTTKYDLISENHVKEMYLENWPNMGLDYYTLMATKDRELYIRVGNGDAHGSGSRPFMYQSITLKKMEFAQFSLDHRLTTGNACEYIQLHFYNETLKQSYYGYLSVYSVGGDPSVSIQFSTTAAWIPLRFEIETGVAVSTLSSDAEDSFSTFDVPVYFGDLLEDDTLLFIRLGDPTTSEAQARADYKGVSLVEMEQDDPEFTSDTRSLKEIDYDYTYEEDTENYFSKKEVTVLSGNHENANSCFTTKHILSYSKDPGDVANRFSLLHTDDEWTWEEYIAKMYLSLFKRPLNTIIGRIKGVTPWDIVVDVDVVRYVFASVSFNAKTGIIDGRLIEALGYVPPLVYDEDKVRVTGDGVRITPENIRYKEDEE